MTYHRSMSFPADLPSTFSARAAAVGLHAEDVTENFILGTGRGGQRRNKRSTTVQLTHRVLDIDIRCSKKREQHQNRIDAWMTLLEKMEERKRDIEQALERRDFVQKAQKRKRTRKGKENVLAEKRERGEIKRVRRRVGP